MGRRSVTRSMARVVLALGLILLPGVPVAAETQPDLAASDTWAWVVVRQAHVSHTPGPLDQGNSTGGTNTVEHVGTGSYAVTMTGLFEAGGTVLVSTLGTSPRICDIDEWNVQAGGVVIGVLCYDLSETLVDSKFVVNFLAGHSFIGQLGYAWDDVPSQTTETAVDGAYAYDSQTGTVTSRQSTERPNHVYVKFPNLQSYDGSVQVTAYKSGSTIPVSCAVLSWSGIVSDLWVEVLCRDFDGVPVIQRFTVVFMRDLGLKGSGGNRVAYLTANKPHDASYTPRADLRFSSAGGVPTITRQGPGQYTVTLPGMKKGGSAQVTAFPCSSRDTSGCTAMVPRHCVVAGIRRDALPQRIGVRCFDFNGTPKDSKFTLAYAK